jgi:hypothetical protein
MDKRERVARALDPEAFGPCPQHWKAIKPKGYDAKKADEEWYERTKVRRMQARKRAEAAIAALEPVTVQDEDQLIAAIWAHYGDLKSAKAALRALAERGE